MTLISNDDAMKLLLTQEEIDEIKKQVDEDVRQYLHGGKREGAGRKPKKSADVLKFTKRLTEKEVNFINYARSHNINYDDLMQG